MAINFKKIWTGLTVVPKTSSTADSQGELEVLSTDSKLRYHNGTSSSPVLTEAHSATVTNKGIDADNNTISNLEVDNLKAGVLNTDTGLAGASDTQVPSALAVKTYVDNSSGAVQTDVNDLITLSGVPANSTDLGTFTGTTIPDGSDNKEAFQALETALEAHISDTADAHDASAISVVPTGNLSADDVQEGLVELQGDIDTINGTLANKVTGPASATDEALVRFDGTTGKLVQNSVGTLTDAGVMAGLTGISSSGTATFSGTLNASGATSLGGAVTASITTDSSSTGTNATVPAPATTILRLTNASLSSIDMISSPTAGRIITLSNQTGNTITVNNDTGGTAANRIYTGTGANLTLKNQATLMLEYDSTASRWLVIGGTGAGTGSGINYILNPDAEAGTSGWATYADAAAAIPVDGTGGTANITFTRSTVDPLRDTASFLITKDAANRQGEGVSYDFTIDAADKASIQRISFDYSSDSGYADGYLRCYIYDVTNSRLIEVDNRDIAATSQGKYVASFQTSSDSVSYRLILHVADSSTTAWTFKLDNVVVGPQNLVKGAAVTDFKSCTLTVSPPTNVINHLSQCARVGDSLEITGSFQMSGAGASGSVTLTMPSGYVVDTAKVPGFSVNTVNTDVGRFSWYDDSGSAASRNGWMRLLSSTTIGLTRDDTSSNLDGTHLASPDRIHYKIKVPIVGWSSNLTLSEDGGQREIVSYASRVATQSIPSSTVTDIDFDVATRDTVGAIDLTNNTITAVESGYYDISAFIDSASSTAARSMTVTVYSSTGVALDSPINSFVPGATTSSTRMHASVAGYYLEKGQYLKLRHAQYSAGALNVDGARLYLAKRSSPQTLAGGETVAARAVQSSGQTMTNATPTTVTYDTAKTYDTHNALNASTGIFTAPSSGIYEIECSFVTGSYAWTATTHYIQTQLYKNSVMHSRSEFQIQSSVTNTMTAGHKDKVYLSKGDTAYIALSIQRGANTALSASASYNFITITKVGN